MSLKNVVKVMNFHSLLRVDRSRKTAKKYAQMEQMVLEMLDHILNNRNVILDVKALKMDPTMPELQIYLGSDLGFCGNLNNLVRHVAIEKGQEEKERRTVIVGRKLQGMNDENTLIYQSREDFAQNHQEILDLLSMGLREKLFSSIRLVYNHYRNASEIDFVNRVIFPMPKGLLGQEEYTEDFVYEGDMQGLLLDLTELYLQYELEIASQMSMAAENITRQNITTESLKKIDERDEEALKQARRELKDKEFAKVLDNFTKLRHY